MLKLRTATEVVGWLNSVGLLDVSPPDKVFFGDKKSAINQLAMDVMKALTQ